MRKDADELMTKAELAKKLKCSEDTIERMERDRKISAITIGKRLKRYSNKSLAHLIG